ncbi:hypothetical protein P3X46_011966 [Hevea brasiliensis]|uniref:Rotamase n=1 Tax=Hevea brasiliensis TaxID=3981 RepID=A0ABQ9MCG8_HEVBR|nr:hypothetical protein P3X46_011966 [Hevea brasiliensis]
MPMATRSLNRIVATVMISSATLSLTHKPAFANLTHPACPDSVSFDAKEKMKTIGYHSYFSSGENSAQKGNEMHHGFECNKITRRALKVLFNYDKCPTRDLDSKLNETNCGRFPIDKGEVVKNVVENENYKEDVENKYKSKVWYRDVDVGKGAPATNDPILQLRIHFILYNDFEQTVHNSKEKNGSPVVVPLCENRFGPGFDKAIQGMRVGGIRRIILPRKCVPMISGRNDSKVKEYGVMDVELVALCASPACCFKNES